MDPCIAAGGAQAQYVNRTVTGAFLLSLCVLCLMASTEQAFGQNAKASAAAPFAYPVQFTENRGQWDARILYAALAHRAKIAFAREGFAIGAPREKTVSKLRDGEENFLRPGERSSGRTVFSFLRPSADMRVSATDPSITLSHFYPSPDRAEWRENVPSFRTLTYFNVWDRIDARFTAADGRCVLEFIAHPGSDPANIVLACTGSDPLRAFSRVTAIRGEGEMRETIPVRVAGKNSIVTFDAGTAPPNGVLLIQAEFSTFFGGGGEEINSGLAVSDADEPVIAGRTSSADLPLYDPDQPAFSGASTFVSKFTADGSQLVYSTYFGSSTPYLPFLVRGKNNSTVLIGRAGGALPLTSDAARALPENYYIARFSARGTLDYCSYLWSKDMENWGSAVSDKYGQIYLLGHTYTTPPFLTPDALFRWHQGSEDGVIMKLNACNDSILYATNFGGATHEEPGSIAVDDSCNIIVTGILLDTGQFPLVNAVQPMIRGKYDLFVSKIDSSGTHLVFSTFLGGSEQENCTWNGPLNRQIDTDARGNIYVAGTTGSSNFPLKNPFQNKLSDATDLFLTKFSPAGQIVYSTFLGGHGQESLLEVRADSAGRACLLGMTSSPDFPLASPRQSSGSRNGARFVCVFDTSGTSLNFSTIWGAKLAGNMLDQLEPGHGSLFVSTTMRSGDSIPPIFNAYQSSMRGSSDAGLCRLNLPIVPKRTVWVDAVHPDSLRLTITAIDTIRIERRTGALLPPAFRVTCVLKNLHRATAAVLLYDKVTLPRALVLSPPGQRISFDGVTLAPGDSLVISLTLALDTLTGRDETYSIETGWRSGCIGSSSRIDVAVVYFDYVVPLACGIQAPDTLKPGTGDNTLVPDPFDLTYTLKYLGNDRSKLRAIRLALPPDLTAVPPGDTLRTIADLAPNETATLVWKIHARKTRWMSKSTIRIFAIDTLGLVQSFCEKSVCISSLANNLSCASLNPDTVRYDWTLKEYLPPVSPVRFQLASALDTVQMVASATIDLSRARHIRLDPGEPATRTFTNLLPGAAAYPSWKVSADTAIQGSVTDTIVLHYWSDGMTDWRECMHVVVLEKGIPGLRLACSIAVADTLPLLPAGDGYAGNPFPVRFTLRNTGLVSGDALTMTLLLPADRNVAPLDSLVARAPLIQPGDSAVALWNLRAYTSRFARALNCAVTARDQSGRQVASCQKEIFLPPARVDLDCEAWGVDTLHFDRAAQRYDPDPFGISLRLKNRIDTAIGGVEAALDCSRAQHLLPDAGEDPLRHPPPLEAGASDTSSWRVRVASAAQADDVDTLLLHYRILPDGPWRSCEWRVMLEAEKKFARAACGSAGNDTIWYSKPWERIAPNPILVRYTLINTGTMPLTGCAVAILPPEQFSVAAGTDSLQRCDPILPGKSESHEWLLAVRSGFPIDTTLTIRWKWDCAELAQDTSCDHAVSFTTRDLVKLVVAPWMLRFRALQNDPPPPAQSVSLLTPSRNPVAWQAQPSMNWLDVTPQSGSDPAIISLRPNTTALPAGIHAGQLIFTAAAPWLPGDVLVEYEIYTLTGAGHRVPEISLSLDQNYPNPFEAGTTIEFRIGSRRRISLEVYDLFGRRVASLAEGEYDAGRHVIPLRRSGGGAIYRPGVYIYTLSADGMAATRKMTVVK